MRISEKRLGILALSLFALGMLLAALGLLFPWLVLNSDQRGDLNFARGNFGQAANEFEASYNRGVALFRDGNFKEAANSFAGTETARALYNRGNCLVMLGKYDEATQCYEDALRLRPEWIEAQENRELAIARAELTKSPGGDAGDQRIGADEIVFDNKQDGGQETEVNESEPASESVQELWLRKVQTKPATFLRSKFAFQAASQGESP